MQDNSIHLKTYGNIIWKHKKLLFISLIITLVLSVVISLLLPKWYKATAVIMPTASEKNKLSGLNTNLSTFGFGSMFGSNEDQMRLMAILKSTNMLKTLDNKFDFQKKYYTKFKFKTYNKINSNLRIEVGEEEQIKISFYDKDQNLVADIVNYIVHSLDSLNIYFSSNKAQENRRFIEHRLKLIQDSLEFYDYQSKMFMQNHEIISLDEQLTVEVKQAAEIKAQIMSKEVELEAMKINYPSSQEHILNAEVNLEIQKNKYNEMFVDNKLNGLFVNLENVPNIVTQYAQLQRKVLYFSKLIEYLGPQYEQAKIEEVKDISTIQVLDKATRPEKKSKPKRAKIVIYSLVAMFLLITINLIVSENKKSHLY